MDSKNKAKKCDYCHKHFTDEDDIVKCRQGFCKEDSLGLSRVHRKCLMEPEWSSEYCCVCKRYRCGSCPGMAVTEEDPYSANNSRQKLDSLYDYRKCCVCKRYACRVENGDDDGDACWVNCSCGRRVCKNCSLLHEDAVKTPMVVPTNKVSVTFHRLFIGRGYTDVYPQSMQSAARFGVYRCHVCLPLKNTYSECLGLMSDCVDFKQGLKLNFRAKTEGNEGPPRKRLRQESFRSSLQVFFENSGLFRDVFQTVANFLSNKEVLQLQLVCKGMWNVRADVVFRTLWCRVFDDVVLSQTGSEEQMRQMLRKVLRDVYVVDCKLQRGQAHVNTAMRFINGFSNEQPSILFSAVLDLVEKKLV